MVPRKTAPSPESSPSNSESSLLGKVPRKTTLVPQKLPSEQDEALKEEPAVGSTTSSSHIADTDTDTPTRSSWGIVPKTDVLNSGSRNVDIDTVSRLPWGYAGKTESTPPGTSWRSKTKDIQADRFGGDDKRLGSAWGLETADIPMPPSAGGLLGKTGGGRADPESVTLATKFDGTLASKPLSAPVKVDPGETARSSALQNGTSGAIVPTRELSGVADHSSKGATVACSQATSGLGRGRGRAIPFWMTKNIQEETGDSRQATKEISSSAPLSSQHKSGRPNTKESGSSPPLSPQQATSMAGENDSTSLSRRQTSDEPARKETSLSGSIFTQRSPNRTDAQARHTSEPLSCPRSPGAPQSSNSRENRPSYPSASRKRDNYSVYSVASREIDRRSSYRSVRPTEDTTDSSRQIGHGHSATGLGRGRHGKLAD
jgi:hypothetical protein